MGVRDHFLSIRIHFQTNSMYRTPTLAQKLGGKRVRPIHRGLYGTKSTLS